MNNCKCEHSKSEHTKAYEGDLEDGEVHGEPYRCLVTMCPCKKFVKQGESA